MKKLIAYDLGTGGIKASLFTQEGSQLAESFIQYDTLFPHPKWVEQRPEDWWAGVCSSTKILLEKSGADPKDIAAVALSGHSMVAVPIDKNGELITPEVPIWCDMRADDVTQDFFGKTNYENWYLTTGNGDPAECYAVSKLMWMKKHTPEVYDKTVKVLGSKDYVNYKFTGNMVTDPSYASGLGVFNLCKWDYEKDFIDAAEIKDIFPEIIPSDAVVGKITKKAANETGLTEGTPVACGGVDNMCMALGATGIEEGRVYTSLGSSSWIAVTSQNPIVDAKTFPFVFAHVKKGYFTSAVSIFSAGNSYRWVRDNLCRDLDSNTAAYDLMNKMAENVPIGSNGVMFNPTLAGGSLQEYSVNTKGAFTGITLATTREDMVRATLEGISMALRKVMDILARSTELKGEMLICGGGSKSALWRDIFANVYNMPILKTNIDQNCASLGAAAIAANACGLWKDYDIIPSLHTREDLIYPDAENVKKYEKVLEDFDKMNRHLAALADSI